MEIHSKSSGASGMLGGGRPDRAEIERSVRRIVRCVLRRDRPRSQLDRRIMALVEQSVDSASVPGGSRPSRRNSLVVQLTAQICRILSLASSRPLRKALRSATISRRVFETVFRRRS